MSIEKLPEVVYPLAQVGKINELVDAVNETVSSFYTATNPALTPVEGVVTWTVTHNLGTEQVHCSLYENDNLVVFDLNIISENQVSVSFMSDVNIEAGTHKILISGNEGSSGGGTSDHAQLTNLSYASSGHTGFLSSADFLPNGTKITVDSNGTGDFTTIQDAINFLSGKWSNGKVTISIANGTYTPTSQITFNGTLFNIPYLEIVGESKTGVIFNFSSMYTTGAFYLFKCSNNILLKQLTINCAGKNLAPGRGINIDLSTGLTTISNVEVTNSDAGICTLGNSASRIMNSIMSTCNIGAWQATGARVHFVSDTFSNISGNAIQLYKGAMVTLDGSGTFNSVASRYSQNQNVVTENGIIMGSW